MYFAEVLARETTCLDGVADRAALDEWRRDVVRELMTPDSPYVLAMQPTSDVCRQADFLERWQELISATLNRVLVSERAENAPRSAEEPRIADVDVQKTALLIVAALNGGSMLSRVTQDRRPLIRHSISRFCP